MQFGDDDRDRDEYEYDMYSSEEELKADGLFPDFELSLFEAYPALHALLKSSGDCFESVKLWYQAAREDDPVAFVAIKPSKMNAVIAGGPLGAAAGGLAFVDEAAVYGEIDAVMSPGAIETPGVREPSVGLVYFYRNPMIAHNNMLALGNLPWTKNDDFVVALLVAKAKNLPSVFDFLPAFR